MPRLQPLAGWPRGLAAWIALPLWTRASCARWFAAEAGKGVRTATWMRSATERGNIMGHHRSSRERGERRRTVRARASMETEQAASYMETLAQALRAGGVTIRSGAGLVALRTSDRIELELEAGEEGRHSAVRLVLRWETPVPEEHLDIVPGVAEQHGVVPEPGQDAGPDSHPPLQRSGGALVASPEESPKH